jgi:hypothetical protein
MRVFSKNLERMISLNRLDDAVDTFLAAIADFQPEEDAGRMEARQIRNQVITLSQRLHQATDNHKAGLTTEDDLSRERLSISTGLLDVIQDLWRYPKFSEHIREMEDEEAWRNASKKNTISAYQAYFNEFPNGKYKDQTRELILELQEVERRRAAEMKRIAEEEKQRREQMQREQARQKAYSTTPPPPPPPREEPQTRGGTDFQRRSPRGTGGYQQQSFGQGVASDGEGEKVEIVFLVIGYILSLIIPLVGLIGGPYLMYSKKNGQLRYNAATRKHGLYLLIVGIVMFIINLSLMMDGYY